MLFSVVVLGVAIFSTDKHDSDLKSGSCVLVESIKRRRKTGEHNARHDLPSLSLPCRTLTAIFDL
jgi:hypothetical protein